VKSTPVARHTHVGASAHPSSPTSDTHQNGRELEVGGGEVDDSLSWNEFQKSFRGQKVGMAELQVGYTWQPVTSRRILLGVLTWLIW